MSENAERFPTYEDLELEDTVYFVSYYSSKGMGNTEALITGEIVSLEQVEEIEKLIEEQEDLTGVKVINFIPLRLTGTF